MKARLLALLTLAALIGLARPARTADTTTVADTVYGMKEHAVMSLALKESGEFAALKGPGPFTLLAPTDAAFKKLDDETLKKIATDKEFLKQLVRAHIVAGKLPSGDLRKPDAPKLNTVHGSAFKVEETKDGLRVGGAKLTVSDIPCSNGVIHVIDTVLIPTK